MAVKIIKVTEHYGYYRSKCGCVYLYPVCHLTKNEATIVTSFRNDSIKAEQECKRLEMLNYKGETTNNIDVAGILLSYSEKAILAKTTE